MNHFLETLNDEQRQAACYDGPADHLMLLAGAGTGKTRTIIGRTIHLLDSNVDPRRILLLTFTRRAAKEMKDRLEMEAGHSALYVRAGTFHNFCLNQMRRRPDLFGIEGRTLFDRDDQLDLMRYCKAAVLKNRGLPKSYEKEHLKPGGLVGIYSYARNTLRPFKEYLNEFTSLEGEVKRVIEEILDVYEKRKQLKGYLDFDDILYIFADMLEQHEPLRDLVKGMYDHILVDEMQDTNPIQWKILENIHDPGKLFCVGDDAQSIYAFRGADFQNVHSFTKRVKNAAILKLKENYRSTQEILDFSNWLLDQSDLNYDKHLVANRGKGIMPVMKTFYNPFREADFVFQEIYKRKLEGMAFNDMMVLVRSAYAARRFESKLLAEKVPYRFIGGLSLLQMAHVKDILALVRAMNGANEELAWLRLLKLFPRIGEASAEKFYQQIQDIDVSRDNEKALYDIFAKRDDVCQVIEAVIGCREPGRAVRQAGKALDKILKENYVDWAKRKRDILPLSEIAARFDSVRKFLEEYALDPEYNEKFANDLHEDKVTIITVHSAKGTEADTCFIIQARAGMFPHTRSQNSIEAIEEERRILYVAMTRAKNELILTSAYEEGSYVSSENYFLEYVPSKFYSKHAHTFDMPQQDDEEPFPDFDEELEDIPF